jgi:hypothetical protein
LSHFASLPCSMVGERAGINTSTAIAFYLNLNISRPSP